MTDTFDDFSKSVNSNQLRIVLADTLISGRGLDTGLTFSYALSEEQGNDML